MGFAKNRVWFFQKSYYIYSRMAINAYMVN